MKITVQSQDIGPSSSKNEKKERRRSGRKATITPEKRTPRVTGEESTRRQASTATTAATTTGMDDLLPPDEMEVTGMTSVDTSHTSTGRVNETREKHEGEDSPHVGSQYLGRPPKLEDDALRNFFGSDAVVNPADGAETGATTEAVKQEVSGTESGGSGDAAPTASEAPPEEQKEVEQATADAVSERTATGRPKRKLALGKHRQVDSDEEVETLEDEDEASPKRQKKVKKSKGKKAADITDDSADDKQQSRKKSQKPKKEKKVKQKQRDLPVGDDEFEDIIFDYNAGLGPFILLALIFCAVVAAGAFGIAYLVL